MKKNIIKIFVSKIHQFVSLLLSKEFQQNFESFFNKKIDNLQKKLDEFDRKLSNKYIQDEDKSHLNSDIPNKSNNLESLGSKLNKINNKENKMNNIDSQKLLKSLFSVYTSIWIFSGKPLDKKLLDPLLHSTLSFFNKLGKNLPVNDYSKTLEKHISFLHKMDSTEAFTDDLSKALNFLRENLDHELKNAFIENLYSFCKNNNLKTDSIDEVFKKELKIESYKSSENEKSSSKTKVKTEKNEKIQSPQSNPEKTEFYDDETNPKYPGEFYFVTNEYSQRFIRIKNFPAVEGVEKLFRKFTKEEVEMIISKIESERVIPLLPFVRDILNTKIDYYSFSDRAPFWFIPFVVLQDQIGCFLIFDQDGIHTNIDNAKEITTMMTADYIYNMSCDDGIFDEFDSKYKGEIKSMEISLYNDDFEDVSDQYLKVTEFFGKGYGSQLKIIQAIWRLFEEFVEKSRGKSVFSWSIPGAPERKEFDSWEELLEWAADNKVSKPKKEKISSENHGEEIIAEVYKEGGIYRAKIKGTDKDVTDLIDNQPKLKYAYERSKLVRGKKDGSGNYNWRVIG